MRPTGSAEVLEARRRAAVKAVRGGMRPSVVAEAHGVTRIVLSRWLKAERQLGDAGLSAKPRPRGKSGKMTAEACGQLRNLVNSPATEHGFPTAGWISTWLARVMKELHQVSVHPWTIRRTLRQMNITRQLPQPEPNERGRNQGKRTAWIEELPALLTNNRD